ncbi:catechol 1,2-dioxygenase [Amycolatopsis sp. NPDC059657]|uniref:DODA-type extradiol aromatic ring-opening family dioxygenase n=1 Tax=Amycolatopsis sp. NPDC059657 TaxID=3346899 RepID=UPI00366E1F9B
MGDIVGAGLLSHSPVIMFPRELRVEANGGKDFTLATGLTRLGEEVIDTLDYDTVIVLDSHWATTTETVITAHSVRQGVFTSDEMPSAICWYEYDLPGDPELAETIASLAEKRSLWLSAVDDPHLPIHYATLNLWHYLGRPAKPWISVSVCQSATPADFLAVGELIADAVALTEKKVLIVASGGLSHAFWPLNEVRDRMAGDPSNIISPEASAADLQRIAWLEAGDHARVIDAMPEYRRFAPEAGFGHYLTLAGAVGGKACVARAVRYSEYENGIGTGQVHLWFPRPEHGWTAWS